MTWMVLTPSGTTKASSVPVGPKAQVVVPEVVENDHPPPGRRSRSRR